MRTRVLAIGLGLAGISSLLGSASAPAATRCVGSGPGCHRTIQAALDAAHDGDAIKVGRGTFAGGISITKSVRLSGAGAGATVIRGGGPVVTIGTPGAASEPTVSIAEVKITGGRTSSSPELPGFRPGGTVQALGGGVFVPPGAEAPGATVTIRDSVISGNRAAPTTTVPSGNATCPDGPCPYAEADGGGIENWGDMKLARTVVSDNEIGGPLASDALGAGIWSDLGSVTLVDCVLARNRATVVAPNGRFAEGGGLLIDGGALTIRETLIDRNEANLTSTLPPFADGELIDVSSHAGGVLIADGVPATIDRTIFAGNSVSAHNPVGEPLAFDSALQVLDSPVTLRDTLVTGNRVTSDTLTTEDVGPSGTAVELDGGGTLTNVHIVGNPSFVKTHGGLAGATSGLAVYDFNSSPDLARVIDSTISGNTAVASDPTGTAVVTGGGVFNNSLLELSHTVVSHNAGKATAPSGVAQGGGIWNGVFLSGPPVELTLTDSLITRNTLTASPGLDRQGGGLFTTEPVTRTRTVIARNAPDQCFGCGAAAARSARHGLGGLRARGVPFGK
jgi:hypothetical protein